MDNVGTGKVVKAFGNLVQVRFEGNIRQGAVAMIDVGDESLKAEVIEIAGDIAKLQVFEDAYDVAFGSPVRFSKHLLSAELGPGLLQSVFDGLQNPLENVADEAGFFLKRGIYLPPLNRTKHWDYHPKASEGDRVRRGTVLGMTMEGRFHHKIMVPFAMHGEYTVTRMAPSGSYTVEEVIATVSDEKGREYPVSMLQQWPIKMALSEGKKVKASEMMETGLRIIDTQFPILKGGTFCTPGPFGAGKTVMQHHLSKYSAVDLVVVTACGERAGEVVEVLKTFPHLTDPHTKDPLISRTVIICNTSSMPVAAREASVYMGVTIAEYYRQMGLNVLLLADSTSRWAQAMREMSGRLEEIPGEEAFPAYLASRIANFYERSGVLVTHDGSRGSVTIAGTVSPAGGNFEEPVTQATLAVVGAFLGLSRQRSDARRYPAIDPLISWSKYVDDVGHNLSTRVEGWAEKSKLAGSILRSGDDIGKRMEVVGEEGIAMDDMIVYLKSELYEFCYLQQNAFDKEDAYCPLERQIAVFDLIQKVFRKTFSFSGPDQARNYFFSLQNSIKNMNLIPFASDAYERALDSVASKIEGGE
ncbi:MAG: V-type ATP synthase subunit A [Simkaniaceae bacterium]|nr:V-type ATP synthase subunit A [Simkaniaceae bacterium]